MRRIYKYELNTGHNGDIRCCCVVLPVGSEVVDFGDQDGELFLWAIIDKEETREEKRMFYVVGPGWDIEDGMTYVKTCRSGNYIWHLLEEFKKQE